MIILRCLMKLKYLGILRIFINILEFRFFSLLLLVLGIFIDINY